MALENFLAISIPTVDPYLCVTSSPIIACSSSMLWQVDVFLVKQVGIGRVEDAVNNTGLQIKKDSSWYIMFIISL